MLKTWVRRFAGKRMREHSLYTYVYGFLVGKKLKRKKIIWMETVDKDKILLLKGNISMAVSPNIKGKSKQSLVTTPDVFIYTFYNVYGNTRASGFHSDRFAYIENMRDVPLEKGKYNSGHILNHNEAWAVVCRFKDTIEITEPAFFLGGNGSDNYFHWMIEIIPKLFYFQRMPAEYRERIKYIIVPKEIEMYKSFKDLYDLMMKHLGLDIPLLSFCRKTELKFKEVYYMTSFNSTLYNVHTDDYQITYYRKDSLDKIRELVVSSLLEAKEKISIDKMHKKFFIRRGNVAAHNKRTYNEDEVFELLESYGYQQIFIEDYSFLEQAYLFHHAEALVAPTGAVFSNLLFAQPSLDAICLISQQIEFADCFSTLAHTMEINLKYISSQALDANIHGSFYVDCNELKNLLENH